MLGPITWLPGLKRLNVLKADDIVIEILSLQSFPPTFTDDQ